MPGNINYAIDVVAIASPISDTLPPVVVTSPNLEGDPITTPVPGDVNYAIDIVQIEDPVNESLPFVIVLPPHLEGDPWGVDVIFPYLIADGLFRIYTDDGGIPYMSQMRLTYGRPTGRPAAAGEIRFYHFSDTTRTPSLVLPAAILNAAAWTFTIPQVSGVVFNLDPVLWFWSLVETSDEEDVEVAIGHLVVRHKDQ
jgi:hypothetical protein